MVLIIGLNQTFAIIEEKLSSSESELDSFFLLRSPFPFLFFFRFFSSMPLCSSLSFVPSSIGGGKRAGEEKGEGQGKWGRRDVNGEEGEVAQVGEDGTKLDTVCVGSARCTYVCLSFFILPIPYLLSCLSPPPFSSILSAPESTGRAMRKG